MGIKIHHGPDGTFKTSGAIKDDIIPIIKSGRVLVTNVRGFSRDNAVKVLGRKQVHKNFKVIFIDTENTVGREKLARFFNWAPNGAFFVIDEVQRIFKPKWREKDLDELSVYVGSDKRTDEIPEDIHTAWDMQRHYNWDFVFTTTSITKVRSEMKDMAKVAIRHINLGLWRFYKTVEHGADNKGTSASQQTNVKNFNYVPSKVFSLYASTKTGAFENSEPRTAFYKDSKVLGLLALLVCLWTYVLSKPAPTAIGGTSKESVSVSEGANKESVAVPKVAVKNGDIQVDNIHSEYVPNSDATQNVILDKPFLKGVVITGSVYSKKEKLYTFHNGRFSFNTMDLMDMGIYVRWLKPCKASIEQGLHKLIVYCSMKKESFVNSNIK